MYKKHVLFWCVYTFSYTFNVYTRSYTLFDATYCHLVLTFQLGSWMFLTCYMWIQCFITRCHSYILTKNCPQTKQFGWPMLPCAFFSLLIRLPKLQDNSNQSMTSCLNLLYIIDFFLQQCTSLNNFSDDRDVLPSANISWKRLFHFLVCH